MIFIEMGQYPVAVNHLIAAHQAARFIIIRRPPSTQRHGENIIAFIKDPDGYRIELVEQKRPEKIAAPSEREMADA